MQTRIFHKLLMYLLMLVYPLVSVLADEPATPSGPDFPPDPGVVYVPPIVIIMGDTIDMSDTTQVLPTEIDLLDDGTIVYNTEENTLTLSSASLEVGDVEGTAISYTGTDTLTIVLQDTSSIYADTIINSQSDVIITGDGKLEAVGTVPIIGTPEASITFVYVYMHVQSVPSAAALRRRIQARKSGAKFGKLLDENGGPAMSGFGSADFGKVNVSPSGANYGSTTDEEGNDINALYVENDDGSHEILTEFETTPKNIEDALPATKHVPHGLDISAPMYNLLGLPVDAGYKGIVLQNGHKYILQ